MHANWCFQSKCSNISAEGLHFSAFHYLGNDFSSNSYVKITSWAKNNRNNNQKTFIKNTMQCNVGLMIDHDLAEKKE